MITDFQRKFIDRTAKDSDGNIVGYHIRKVPECEPYSGKFLSVEAFEKAERQIAIFQAGKEAIERDEANHRTKINEPTDDTETDRFSIPEVKEPVKGRGRRK